MKKRWLPFAVAVLIASMESHAPGEEAPPLASVRVEVQMVSVSVADAQSLVPAFHDAKIAPEAYARVQEMLVRDEATLMGWQVLWLRCGHASGDESTRASSESILEVRSSAEPDPPHFPAGFKISPRTYHATWGPFTPVGYTTRNTEASVEATAMVSPDGRIVTLDLVAQFVRCLPFNEYRLQRSGLGIEGIRMEPNIWTSKTSIQLRVVRDLPALVGTFVVTEPEPHVELFFLRARPTLLPPGVTVPAPVLSHP